MSTFSAMTCDGCGLVDDTFQTDITGEEIKNDPEKVLMSVKTYFQDAGWYISMGYDLCPTCKETKPIPPVVNYEISVVSIKKD